MKRLIVMLTVVLTSLTVWAQTYTFDFATGQEGWIGGFADYPSGSETFYELDFKHQALPTPLDTNQMGLFITGNNHRDDLFMYIKKNITGLMPHTSYRITFNIEFASKYPTNAVGVGGAPGEGVTMKAGATLTEPNGMYALGDVRMNIDKSNQAQPGTDMDTIGHVGVANTTTAYALKSNNNISHTFSITTDATGEVWIIIGTDSGFEATTALYYNKIEVTFSATLGINDHALIDECMIYPNPSHGTMAISHTYALDRIEIYSLNDQLVQTVNKPKKIISLNLPSGIYFLKGYTMQNGINFSKKIVVK